jgi:hypothetical protein
MSYEKRAGLALFMIILGAKLVVLPTIALILILQEREPGEFSTVATLLTFAIISTIVPALFIWSLAVKMMTDE